MSEDIPQDTQDTNNSESMEFDWLQLHKEIGAGIAPESTQDRFSRKFKENPLVPLGCLATVGALSYGLWSFRQGNKQMSQYMMRMRIAAQGFTVIALIAGIGLSAMRN